MPHTDVRTCAEAGIDLLHKLLNRYQMQLVLVDDHQPLPGSFWGDPEAGLIANTLYIRPHTPVQSALHEACHYICMDEGRRSQLHTDAGGGYDEENAVCYLQILLARELSTMGQARMLQDMDAWGYSFRLGSAAAWFEQDADDARQWLLEQQLITHQARPSWRLRQ